VVDRSSNVRPTLTTLTTSGLVTTTFGSSALAVASGVASTCSQSTSGSTVPSGATRRGSTCSPVIDSTSLRVPAGST